MTVGSFRTCCLSLPRVTEHVQWGDHLVFKVGGKPFAITSFEPGENFASIKCSAERFQEMVELPGVRPAPYLARAHWVALESGEVLGPGELKRLLQEAYEQVRAALPKKVQLALNA